MRIIGRLGPVLPSGKQKRNALCRCGSGLKYKSCPCYLKDRELRDQVNRNVKGK